MNKPSAFPLVLALAFATAAGLAGCGKKQGAAPTTAAPRQIQAGIVTLQPIQSAVLSAVPGTVVAEQSVRVASRLMGYIKKIDVVEGQTVKAGQRLFTIDPTDVDSGVAQARQGLEQANKALQDAKADYDRFNALYKEEVISRRQYQKMRLNYDIAASRAAQARAGLAHAQGQLKYAVVRSPINGVVVQKFADRGDIAAPGHPVMQVENPSRLQVQTAVPESIYSTLEPGRMIRVAVDGRTLKAKIARLSPAADPVAHTHLVKLEIKGRGLRSGAFARVLFPTGKQTVLEVPAESVLDRAGITGVFVVDKQGLAEYRMVRTGRSEDGRVRILSGLSAGERVVTDHASTVENGDQVVAEKGAAQKAGS